MKDERKIINHHCEEVQELMGAVPNKLVRWGISAIALVLLVVFVCSCFFYYPETLTAGVTIIPLNPPVEIRAGREGYLKELMTANGRQVRKGEVVAVLETTDSDKNRLILRSPIDGRVNFMEAVMVNRHVSAGETLITVLPNTTECPVGEMRLPASQVGEVKRGQLVKIKLELFPEDKYGSVEGRVGDVSKVPDGKGMYYTQVTLSRGMETDNGLHLPSNQRLTGIAEIVVGNNRLIERFIQPMQRLFKMPQ